MVHRGKINNDFLVANHMACLDVIVYCISFP